MSRRIFGGIDTILASLVKLVVSAKRLRFGIEGLTVDWFSIAEEVE